MHHAFPATRGVALVDARAIDGNFKLLRAYTAGRGKAPRLIAVVKANAYGHSIAIVVPTLLAAGCDFFAVATAEEALQVRLLAPDADVLILGYTPPKEASLLAEAHIIQTVFSTEYAEELAERLKKHPLSVHIKLDCGMHRLGFAPECVEEISAIAALPSLHVVGLFTHFPSADTDLPATRVAFSRFLRCKNALEAGGLSLFCHAAASAALPSLPEAFLDGVRPGLALYGLSAAASALPLLPAMRLQAPLVALHRLPANTPIGYGGAFVTKRPAKIGVCPLGYGDGLPRAAEGFLVRLMHRGIPFSVPIVGHICMDYVTVDLTDTPAALGDTVIFWDDPRPLATHVGTIPYEILTAISPRVERKKKGDPT